MPIIRLKFRTSRLPLIIIKMMVLVPLIRIRVQPGAFILLRSAQTSDRLIVLIMMVIMVLRLTDLLRRWLPVTCRWHTAWAAKSGFLLTLKILRVAPSLFLNIYLRLMNWLKLLIRRLKFIVRVIRFRLLVIPLGLRLFIRKIFVKRLLKMILPRKIVVLLIPVQNLLFLVKGRRQRRWKLLRNMWNVATVVKLFAC